MWGSLNFLNIFIFILYLSPMFSADFSSALEGLRVDLVLVAPPRVFGACEVTYSERITMANRPGTQLNVEERS